MVFFHAASDRLCKGDGILLFIQQCEITVAKSLTVVVPHVHQVLLKNLERDNVLG